MNGHPHIATFVVAFALALIVSVIHAEGSDDPEFRTISTLHKALSHVIASVAFGGFALVAHYLGVMLAGGAW